MPVITEANFIIEMLTISWLIDLHFDWQLRRYSKSSSDLVISVRKRRVLLTERSKPVLAASRDILRRYGATVTYRERRAYPRWKRSTL